MDSLLQDEQADGIALKAADRASEAERGRAALKAMEELRASYLHDERTLLAFATSVPDPWHGSP